MRETVRGRSLSREFVMVDAKSREGTENAVKLADFERLTFSGEHPLALRMLVQMLDGFERGHDLVPKEARGSDEVLQLQHVFE